MASLGQAHSPALLPHLWQTSIMDGQSLTEAFLMESGSDFFFPQQTLANDCSPQTK